jgi:ParB family transcriptional regulator, chromosome partitioning protein
MPALKPTAHPQLPQIVPTGSLLHLDPQDVKPSANNPRLLFDIEQLAELKKNIAEHGVLVPITVYQAKGQSKYSILDGERRFRCVVELRSEGHLDQHGEPLKLPANVVEPPTKIAGLLYMFSIHEYRQAWELMPTALSLKIVIDELGVEETKVLSKFTGLSEPQIERCKKLLKFPERFQRLSLDPNPATRIPSNFWIEALPVIDLALEEIPRLKDLGRDKAIDKLVDKYRARKIKSVIHFRRIMESYELSEDDGNARRAVLRRIEEFFVDPALETRAAFDQFIVGKKRIQTALSACVDFIKQLRSLKLRFTADDDERTQLRKALRDVQQYCKGLEQALTGSDDPEIPNE